MINTTTSKAEYASLPATHNIKHALRKVLYKAGLLGLVHRYRNARTLTTFMFHRVLPQDSAAYRCAEKEFTFTFDGFSACLEFIQRHYHVVSLADLEAAKQSGRHLPSRAALITFDDGWLDTIAHAYPELQRRGLPGVVFVATEILEFPSDRWWQDALVGVLSDSRSAQELAQALGLSVSNDAHSRTALNQATTHAMTAAVAALPVAQRLALLSLYTQESIPGRQMMTTDDLKDIDRTVLTLAAHGHTHAPLNKVTDPGAELRTSHEKILAQGGHNGMSFPHGAYDADLVDLAQRSGFRTIFTSDACLTGTSDTKMLPRVLGRIHVPENEWTCDADGISFPKLATFLFFRPIAGEGA